MTAEEWDKFRNMMLAHLDGVYRFSARENCDELVTTLIQHFISAEKKYQDLKLEKGERPEPTKTELLDKFTEFKKLPLFGNMMQHHPDGEGSFWAAFYNGFLMGAARHDC